MGRVRNVLSGVRINFSEMIIHRWCLLLLLLFLKAKYFADFFNLYIIYFNVTSAATVIVCVCKSACDQITDQNFRLYKCVDIDLYAKITQMPDRQLYPTKRNATVRFSR